MTVFEDLKTGRLAVVPREATTEMQNAMAFYHINHAGPAGDAEMSLARSSYKAMLSRAPDHTAGLIALVEGMEARAERAEAEIEGLAALCKGQTSRLVAAEARALAAEAERDALREALAFYADEDNYKDRLVTRSCGCCSDHEPAAIGPDGDEGQVARAALARALTEKNNGNG